MQSLIPQDASINPAHFDLINTLNNYLSQSQPGRAFQGIAQGFANLPSLLQPNLSNIGMAGDVVPFSKFALKSLQTEQGLTEFGKIAAKLRTFLPESATGIGHEGLVDFATKILQTPDEVKKIPWVAPQVAAAEEYMNWMKKRDTLKSLDLPASSLDYFIKPSKEISEEGAKVIKFKSKE